MNLFDDGAGEVLPVTDADLTLWRRVDFGNESLLLSRLIEETHWKEERATVWGKSHFQPRLVSWHGDADASYTYSGVKLVAMPWTPLLQEIKAKVEVLCDLPFNSVLLNFYRNNRDSMGFHSDDEPELRSQPVIASVSFGEERRFILKHKNRKDIDDVTLPLPSGSLLLMKGDTQRNWKHGIPKETKPCGPRVNLTFRTVFRL